MCTPEASTVGPAPCEGVGFDTTGSEGSALLVYVDAGSQHPAPTGDADAPWRSLTAALKSIPPGAGDTSLLLAPGTYVPDAGQDHFRAGPGPGVPGSTDPLRILGRCESSTRLDAPVVVTGTDTQLVLARLEVPELSVGSTVGSIEVRSCTFRDDSPTDANGLRWISDTDGVLRVERCAFEGFTSAGVSAEALGELVIQGSRFEDNYGAAVQAENVGDLQVIGSRFESKYGLVAVELIAGASSGSVSLESNWMMGGTPGSPEDADAGVRVSGYPGRVVLMDNSIRGFGTAIWIEESRVSVVSNRVTGSATRGLFASASQVKVSDSRFAEIGGNGLQADNDSRLEIERSVVAWCGESGVHASKEAAGMTVVDTVLIGNRVGLDARGREATVRDSQIGASETIGVRIRLAFDAAVTGSVIASSGSTGLELHALLGDADAVYDVSGNHLADNVGLGLLVRSTGKGLVRLLENTVVDTRGGLLNPGESDEFVIGDGVAILTGTDDVGSNARFRDNTVAGNYRLGVIADGAGTELNVETNDLQGEGRDRRLDGEAINLVVQGGATAKGSHAGEKTSLGGEVAVASTDEDPIALGGPGDPWRNGP